VSAIVHRYPDPPEGADGRTLVIGGAMNRKMRARSRRHLCRCRESVAVAVRAELVIGRWSSRRPKGHVRGSEAADGEHDVIVPPLARVGSPAARPGSCGRTTGERQGITLRMTLSGLDY
jgi:hypothetical protein